MRRNLKREFEASREFSWALCFRDRPLNRTLDAVWVVSGANDLRWTLDNRRAMGVREVWAGPNIVVAPQEKGELLLDPRIDRIVVPSNWVASFYEKEAPALRGKLCVWPVGIDTDYWKPTDGARKCAVLYNKKQNEISSKITEVLKRRGVPFETVIYGQYTAARYLALLRRAFAVVWLSRSESQGLALLEALSANVPALIWDPGEGVYHSKALKRDFSFTCSSAPYFDERCGLRFQNAEEFKRLWPRFIERQDTFKPRAFIFDQHLDIRTNLSRMPLLNERMGTSCPT